MPPVDPATLEDAIERALGPLKRMMPPRTLEKMREQMREYATTHPYPVALLRTIGPEPVVHRSGDRPADVPEQDGDGGQARDVAARVVPLQRVRGGGGRS